jgi:hypothetical protein
LGLLGVVVDRRVIELEGVLGRVYELEGVIGVGSMEGAVVVSSLRQIGV